MTTLAVFASGMVTALGFNAPASLAAVRAGVSAVRASPWLDVETGEPLGAAKVSLPQWWEGVGKYADLLAPSVHECLESAGGGSIRDVPILIGLSARERPARTPRLEEDLLDELAGRFDAALHPDTALFPADQFGCAQALVRAHALLSQGRVRRVIVAGVDSFLTQATLDHYMERRRLVTPTNSNGFCPGEGAAALLVGPAGDHDGDELRILGIGMGMEPAPIDSDAPCRATGLTQALRQALASAGVTMKDVAFRLTDLSGEHYAFKEAAFVAGRLDTMERETAMQMWHPIEYLGHVGAAILPFLLAHAMHATRLGYAPGRLAVCHIGSDAGQRAALVVGLRNSSRESPRS
jgi:3-oxoacyl-[acyl-carrier-protein] synthase-1